MMNAVGPPFPSRFLRPKRLSCLRAVDRLKADALPRFDLREARQIGGDHRGNFRIAADRLAIGQQDDGLPVARHLHRSRRHPIGNDVGHGRCAVRQRGTVQTHAHAIALRADRVLARLQDSHRLRRKVIVLRPGHHPDRPGIVLPRVSGKFMRTAMRQRGTRNAQAKRDRAADFGTLVGGTAP